MAAPCIPGSFPRTETVNQELEGTGRSGRENSWMLLIILWLEAVVPDTCYPLTFVREPAYPTPPQTEEYWYNEKDRMLLPLLTDSMTTAGDS